MKLDSTPVKSISHQIAFRIHCIYVTEAHVTFSLRLDLSLDSYANLRRNRDSVQHD